MAQPPLRFVVWLMDTSKENFLVETKRYQHGVTRSLERMEPIHMSYVSNEATLAFTEYDGIVLHRDILDTKDWPHNPCKSVHVKWKGDDDDTDNLSPWDFIPTVRNLKEVKDVMPSKINTEINKRWASWLSRNKSKTTHFLNSPMEIQGYLNIVAMPMWIKLMRKRLVKGYYRSADNLIGDVNLMHHNCSIYNQKASDIYKYSRIIHKNLIQIINDVVRDEEEKVQRKIYEENKKTKRIDLNDDDEEEEEEEEDNEGNDDDDDDEDDSSQPASKKRKVTESSVLSSSSSSSSISSVGSGTRAKRIKKQARKAVTPQLDNSSSSSSSSSSSLALPRGGRSKTLAMPRGGRTKTKATSQVKTAAEEEEEEEEKVVVKSKKRKKVDSEEEEWGAGSEDEEAEEEEEAFRRKSRRRKRAWSDESSEESSAGEEEDDDSDGDWRGNKKKKKRGRR